jgi:hypothetical protein
MDRRSFLKKAGMLVGMGAVVSLRHYLWGALYEPGYLKLEKFDLILPGLSPEFDGFRLVQISDIHFDQPMMDGFILRLVQLINGLNPQAVVITGDFLGGTAPFHQYTLASALGHLEKKIIKLAILGNHDHFVNPYAIRGILVEAGFKVLLNEIFTVRNQGSTLFFCGLDDPLWKKDDLDRILTKLPSSGAAILMVHEPDYIAQISDPSRFDLVLSGHTHGGQICLPLLGPLFRPEMGKKYLSGLYRVGDLQLYVNRGLGQVSPHFRYHAPPEITLFRLFSASHHI